AAALRGRRSAGVTRLRLRVRVRVVVVCVLESSFLASSQQLGREVVGGECECGAQHTAHQHRAVAGRHARRGNAAKRGSGGGGGGGGGGAHPHPHHLRPQRSVEQRG